MKKNVISVTNLEKKFSYTTDKPNNLKSILIQLLNKKYKQWNRKTITVLNNISFDISEGEFVGVMGRNGAGKTTLLCLLTGIFRPTSGTISIKEKIAPMISLGAGFNPEMSGYENIFLNSAILGFGRQQVLSKVDNIIEFSELKDKIHMPVKKYSSGMTVRLGFSIAAHLDAKIMLLDEIFGVGDVGFAKKCINKILQLHKEKNRTIVLINHSPDTVAKYCSRCIVLEKGHKLFDGDPKEGAQKYRSLFK